jgi:ribosomal-protein-alanine N-acetyltransferase
MSSNIFDQKLKTERLILRRLELSDVQDMFEYTSNPDVTKYLEWNHHKDISLTRSFINKAIANYENDKTSFLWAIELGVESALIGVVRIYDYSHQNRRAEISYILNPRYHGNGYISEAIDMVLRFCFDNLLVGRIQAKCDANNIASEKVMNKAGMLREGIMRNYFFAEGEYKDALLYAITVDDYQKNG